MHVEPRELVAVHSPDVGESGRKGSTGFLERSGIGPKRNNPITLSDEFVCFCGKPDPVGGELTGASTGAARFSAEGFFQ